MRRMYFIDDGVLGRAWDYILWLTWIDFNCKEVSLQMVRNLPDLGFVRATATESCPRRRALPTGYPWTILLGYWYSPTDFIDGIVSVREHRCSRCS